MYIIPEINMIPGAVPIRPYHEITLATADGGFEISMGGIDISPLLTEEYLEELMQFLEHSTQAAERRHRKPCKNTRQAQKQARRKNRT